LIETSAFKIKIYIMTLLFTTNAHNVYVQGFILPLLFISEYLGSLDIAR